MKGTKFFLAFASAALSVVTLAGVAFAEDAQPTPAPTPNKGQCRSFPNKLKALNKQLSTQTAKQTRTQAKLDELNTKIAALQPTATPTPDPLATPAPTATPGHGKGHGNSDAHKLASLIRQRDNTAKKIERILARIALVNSKVTDINGKLALCPTPTPAATPTPSA